MDLGIGDAIKAGHDMTMDWVNYGTNLYTNYKNRRQQEKLLNWQLQNQKEFAQNSIQWRVADARKAGLHPLAALGTIGTTYTPMDTSGVNQSHVRVPKSDLTFLTKQYQLENKLLQSQADYYSALAADTRDRTAKRGLSGQNTSQMSGLIGQYFGTSDNKTNGDNLKMFGIGGDEQKQPLQDFQGEHSFLANQRTLAKGILDGSINYKNVDEYLTAFGPGVVETKGETILDAVLDTIKEHSKSAINNENAPAIRAIRNSNLPIGQKLYLIQELISNNRLPLRKWNK